MNRPPPPAWREYQDRLASGDLTEARVTTPQIRVGDVVTEHGMLVLIEGPARVFHGQCDYDHDSLPDIQDGPLPALTPACHIGYAWPGRVLNLTEVRAAGVVPPSVLYDTERSSNGPGHGREDSWTIQGNDRASWTVARRR